MAIKQELGTLLTKKMDRKDFLKHVGVAVIAMTGVAALIRTLSSVTTTEEVVATKPQVARKRGYGNSGYGSKIS